MEMHEIKEKVSDYCSKDTWKARFPISIWLPTYKIGYAINDFVAGITVALTVLPQGLAYASIAKLPAQYGLYSSFMGCFVYFFLGMSKDITVGPTAIMSLLVSSYGTSNSTDDTLNDPAYAITLACICGLIQIVIGVLHLGALTSFISATVISGFTTASALTIGAGQIKNLFGISYEGDAFYEDIIGVISNITDTNVWDLLLGSVSLIILFLLKVLKDASMKWEERDRDAPTSYIVLYKSLWLLGTARNAVVVIASALVAVILESTGHEDALTLTGEVPAGLPSPSPPDFSLPGLMDILGVGIAIVPLIGFLEAIAIGKGFGRQNGYKVEPNQELIALGSCNVLGSFFSSYPVTGSFSRTSINNQSGVKTQAGNLVTGTLVILSLLFITPAFQYIPKAALAAVIISAVFNMMNFRIFLQLWKLNKLDLLPLSATFISSLFLGVAYGTLIGIGIDLLILLYPSARPQIKVEFLGNSFTRGQHRGYGTVVPVGGESVPDDGLLFGNRKFDLGTITVVHLLQGLFYPSAEFIQDKLTSEIVMNPKVEGAIIDFDRITNLDYSIIVALKDFVAAFQKSRGSIDIASIKGTPSDNLVARQVPVIIVFTGMNETIENQLKQAEFGDAVAFCADMNTALSSLASSYD
ncbi:sodium-independent sulfate anion transporter-like [Antedon mediterranea]|uniref:sodium-independent sulfate anion transporter-like n=1 Tax=Antedon mediterranea TaxID=105859 RepID=UPI003AF4CA85